MNSFRVYSVSGRKLPRFIFIVASLMVFLSVFSVVEAQPPALILSKTTDGNVTTAEVGQVLHYRVRFECSSLSTACGQLEITDVLQPGLTYLPSPESSVPAGFSINYNAGTRTVTITKDDNNFLDGTQFDAVIAVQVDYNLRPLPTTLNNTVNGRVDPPGPVTWLNATPSSAPPITVDTATLDWGMTKTLYRPSIDPTLDTDVTYQIALCPNTTIGNVALQNIVITDTLPTGAVFVSATNGGTAVGNVVTWPTVVGPTYPPACITRFVTVRYPSATFAIGNNVTNTASANGEYLGSAGAIIGPGSLSVPPVITHPIDPISEVPNYSKSDAGDPVGIDGTARFILNLDTNSTNYPSNSVVLIDNLPPNLQVSQVTTGTWAAAFNNVRATVEYSTDLGTTWTAFPAQPISYNTNATYAAPATNITNVRWRFEYDDSLGVTQQGLPYTWSFATRPEIRVIPRLVAATADDVANTPLPVAAPGNTYTNCLQVSRINSGGNPVTEACHNETMTVQGNFASLRTYKDETPGTSWDEIGDPNITTFTADTTILPNDTVRYVITAELTERSSAPLINPTIVDTIPAGLIFVRNGMAQLDGANLPAAQQPTFTQVGNDLTWQWAAGNAITVNQQVLGSRFLTVEFYARIPRGQAPGPYTNDLTVVTNSVDAYCEVGNMVEDSTLGDLDGDGDPTDPACVNPDTYVVERSAALRGEKWIRSTDPTNAQVLNSTTLLPDATCPNGGTVGLPGGGTNAFTRFPCISQAFPEGAFGPGQLTPPPPAINAALDDFEYNLRVFNDGNVDMTQYVLYDILPYFGDTGSGGTLSSTPRLSEFQPLMRGPVQFISGPAGLTAGSFTIQYNNTINPCRPEVFNQAIGANTPGGCDNTWSNVWTANARSYRIRMNTGVTLPQTATTVELRFGVPMYIPADAPPVGTFTANDPQTLEIAWNSFSHTGSYLDPGLNVRDLLASEPRKVGITIPERMSIGNRVWRDADNSGTINAPDDTNPGIANVVVNLYRDADNNGVPDGVAIATTTTDANGYYLFSNIAYDAVTAANNLYIVGIPASNFGVGQPLNNLKSSTGPLPAQAYVNPALGTTDSDDNGRDPATAGQEVYSATIDLTHNNQPTGETDLSTVVPAPGVPSTRDGAFGRGVNGEQDNDSNLQIDFGFFSQIDYFSIGNRVWFDNGAGGGVINNGIMDGGEQPFANVTVELYRDGNANNQPDAAELIRTDTTDAGGYYLFDQLDPGNYFVVIPASNFNVTTGVLKGLFSSQPTGTELAGVAGNPNTPNTDRDDNGINVVDPSVSGVRSGVIALVLGTPEATGESDLSLNPDPGAATHFNNNPTAWDGPGSIGRYGEDDDNSNITIDFGFIPPLSIGNRVWFDSGAGTTPNRLGFNNGLMDGAEPGVSGVRVELWQDTDGTAGLQRATDTFIASTTTDANGYYLFDRLPPGTNYYIQIPADNFGNVGAGDTVAGDPLAGYISSYDPNQTTLPADDNEDTDDNGIDNAAPQTNGITSSAITMAYGTEPLTPANETDLSGNAAAYGPNNVGLFGQQDANSNLTFDFGFVRPPRSIGNRLWYDLDNDRVLDAGELPVAGARVSLYLDTDQNGQVDDLGVLNDRTDDWIAFDITDANGYYLFDNLPPNYYIVGVDRLNFAAGGPLEEYSSSTGNVDNASNNTDSRDNGRDRILPSDATASPHGVISTRINLTATPLTGMPTGETSSGNTITTLGFNPTAGDGANSRGRYGETDANSDLTIDFGFFKPLSVGNRVFLDNGAGGGIANNGIMDGGEVGIPNVRVEIYSDNIGADGIPDGAFVNFDTTDANGYYLFDKLAAGNYVIGIPGSNFAVGAALSGLNSSQPTGTENGGIGGNPYTPNTDRDDNGVNATNPGVTGVFSGTIALTVDTEPTGEAEISGQANPGNATNANFSPTGWDGPTSSGRWGESDDNSNLTVDFGFILPLSIGNRVWRDNGAGGASIELYNDGIQNGTEAGIANVALSLYFDINDDGDFADANENIAIRTTTTDANGYYLFDGLAPGNYQVGVDAANFGATQPLNGLQSSTGNTADITTDINDNGIDDVNYLTNGIRGNTLSLRYGTQPLTPAVETDIPANNVANTTAYGANLRGRSGEVDADSNLTMDFGFIDPPYSLGNRVWLDGDNSSTINGADGGTPGITGVTVNLLDGAGAPVDNPNITGTQNYVVTTDANGYYRFDGLPAGNYMVEIAAGNFTGVNPLFGLTSSTGVGQLADPNAVAPGTDNDDNGLDTPVAGAIRSGIVALGPGNSEPTAEADNAGVGGFNGQGPAADNRSNLTVDFGFYQGYSLGNRVWLDTDNSGTINGADGGTPGIANVVVNLLTTGGATVDNPNITGTQPYIVTTDANGYYRFDNLPAGDYVVEIAAGNFTGVNPLFGLTSSTGAGQLADPNAVAPGTDDDDNGLDTPVAGAIRSGTVTLGTGLSEPTAEVDNAGVGGFNGQGPTADGRSNLTVDFGFFGSYVLGNRVWLDTDNSGTINGGETGIANVVVNLLTPAGATVDNPNITGVQDYVVTTDANGYYRFDGLPAGNYMVEIAASNFTGVNPLFGLTSSTGAGQLADPNAVAPGTDDDDNGLDTPVAGAIRSGTVTLGTGLSEPTAEADNAGVGGFNGQGPTADGRSNLTVDFGFYQGYSLGNRVWIDINNSGNIDGADGGAPGVANVLVNLLTTAGATVDNPNITGTQAYTATTDANGYYRFDNLPAGDYVVEIAASNFPTATDPLFGLFNSTGAAQLADPNAVAPGTDSDDNGLDALVAGAVRSGTVTLGTGLSEPTTEVDNAGASGFNGQGPTADGRSNLTVDFGFYPVYTLGNRVWADLDNSGNINGADTATPGIAGVTVNLLTTGGATVTNPNLPGNVPYTVTTDANGYYRFDNLPAGDYVVEVAATNFAAGGVLQNAVSSIGAAQEANPNNDVDSNDNGLDTPVAGAIRSGTVTLGPGDVEPTNDTDVPAAGAFAGQGPTVNLRANMSVDFGFVPGFSLGNRVWMDDGIGGGVANDGLINGGELGIAGVQVQLLDGLGAPADNPGIAGIQPYIVTTDANGYYRFDRLPAGDYMVEVIASNFTVGQPLQSVGSSNVTEANPNLDVDNTDNGIDALPAVAVRSGVVTLGPGYNEPLVAAEPDIPAAGAFAGQGTVDAWANMTVDFGFVRLFSLGNRVWRDDGTGGGGLNDGIQTGGEPGINGVVVRLLDALGNPADNPNIAGVQDYTVTTSPQGYYRFDNLSAGNYIVEIVAANFVGGGTLANFSSSTGAEANPNVDGDTNDNGLDVPVLGGIRSGQVTLGPLAAEPVGENAPVGQGAPDLQANMTVDFGFVPGSYSLGNRVWIDANNSGDINGGEAGVNGVTVRLLNNVGTLITTTTTADGGYYRFDNLAAGNYIVEVAASNFGALQPLFGLVSSTGAAQLADPNAVAPGTDSDDNGLDTPFTGAIRSGTVTLGPGDSEPFNEADVPVAIGQGALDVRANMTVDFGFITPPIVFSLGNRVWFDADNNCTINAFDGPTPGIANVTVNLLNAGGAVVATTTTDATGHYRFDNLAAGDYIVEVAAGNFTAGQPLLNLISSSGPGQEANPNSDVDNNDNGLDVPVGGAIRSNIVTLGPTEPTGEIDVVAGAPGAAPDAQSNLTVDFGFTNPVNTYSLGNHVWRDNGAGANTNNGLMDAGEPGIFNVTVNLLDATGNVTVATTTTDANGYYRFDNLPAGNYIVQIAASNFTAGQPLEATTSSTGAQQEANPNGDVDLNDNGLDVLVAGAVRSGTVTLGGAPPEPSNETDLAPSGQGTVDNRANMTVDFGFVDAFSLGNRVWRDDGTGGGTANNGIQDGGEVGIANVTVRLLDSTGNTLIATTTTDANGYYRFDNLAPATYIVEIAAGNFTIGNPLNGLSSSPVTNPNPNSDVDSDDNGLDVAVAGAIRSGQVTLGPTANEPPNETDLPPSGQGSPDNRANMTVDFGFGVPTNTFSLGNRVWLDDGTGGGVANNGIQENTEFGEAGVTVNLLDNTGTFILGTTTTDANGYYRFDGLAAGNYIVEVAASNFGVGQPLNGLLSSAVTVADPNSDTDLDDNGIDAPPGSAIRSGLVTLAPTEPLNEDAPTGQGSPDDRANMTVDFGFAPPAATYSLGNRVWLDTDNSGTINGAETGIVGVTVRLMNVTGTTVVATTTTDANGYYRFDNLAPGDYLVEIAATNFTAGQPLEGLASSSGAGQEATPNSDVDSNDNGLDTVVNGAIRSAVVTLGADSEPTAPAQETDVAAGGPFAGQGALDNRSNLTVDFGFTSSYSLGNRVWYDVNNNSTLDAGEVGVAGVRVELYRDTDNNGAYTAGTDVLINSVTTDGTGYYLFTGLAAADYIVVIPSANFDNVGDPLYGYFSSATSRDVANGNLIETAAPDPDNDTDSDDNGTTIGTLGTVNYRPRQ